MGVLTFGALLYLGRRAYRWMRPSSGNLPQWSDNDHPHDIRYEKSPSRMKAHRRTRLSRRNPERLFKILLVFFIVGFYYIWACYVDPPTPFVKTSPRTVQHGVWKATPPDEASKKAQYVQDAVRHSFNGYRNRAWGWDDVDALTGVGKGQKDGKAGYLLEITPVLAVMGMWEEFEPCVRYMVDALDWETMHGLLDPADVTSRYLGAMVSLLEMADAGHIPEDALSKEHKAKIMEKTVQLADKLLPAFNSRTGLPYPRIDGKTGEGVGKLQSKETGEHVHVEEYAIDPDHASSMLLETVALSRLLSQNSYRTAAEKAWSLLTNKRSPTASPASKLLTGPIDIFTGTSTALDRHWDHGHGIYYATLLNSLMLGISSSLSSSQAALFNTSANTLRWNVTAHSAPTDSYRMQHLYIGRFDGTYYSNIQSQHACAAASTLILGGAYLQYHGFTIFGQTLLEGCHHVFNSTPHRIGAESWSWVGMPLSPNGTISPTTKRARVENERNGYWTVDPRFTWNPGYFKSLFYAWRVTGEVRYRDWAWDAFRSLQRELKTGYGYAGLKDVMDGTKKADVGVKKTDIRLSGEGNGADVVQCLRWLWLTFADTEVGSLDKWVFTGSGNMLKRG